MEHTITQDFETLQRRWTQYWQRDNQDRPLISALAPAAKQLPPVTPPATLAQQWEDPEYVVAAFRRNCQNTYFGGEAMAVLNPNLGPDILGAVAGGTIAYGPDTSWAVPCVEDWESHPPLAFGEENPWWKKIEAITQAAVADARGQYLVGITDLHPGTDGLVSLRGPQELCIDLIEAEDQVLGRVDEMFEIYREVYNRLDAIIAPHQQGTINWMGIWHPTKRWYVVGSDFSCLISSEDFERFVVPGLLRELAFVEGAIYHLDGPGALRHLDRILQLPGLDGVQWVYGAGQPSAQHWIPVLQTIQQAGKCIQVNCLPQDVGPVCEALDPQGVHLVVEGCTDAQQVQQILDHACRSTQRGMRRRQTVRD